MFDSLVALVTAGGTTGLFSWGRGALKASLPSSLSSPSCADPGCVGDMGEGVVVRVGETGESWVGVLIVDRFLGLIESTEDFLPGELMM